MHGSPLNQVRAVFAAIDKIGSSKHQDKINAVENGAVTKHDIGQKIGVYSYETREQYINVAVDLAKYARQEFGIRDIARLTSDAVNNFLENKIASGVAKSTFDKYAAAIEKFVSALNTFKEQHNLPAVNIDISSSREMAKEMLERTQPTRAYEEPTTLINAIKDPVFKTIAQAQLAGGFRISELNHISLKNFKSDNIFEVIQGKGGLNREVELPKNVYNSLLELAKHPNLDNGKFGFDMNQYRDALKQAAKETGQEYTGSHGLRWNAAQNKYIEYSAKHGEVRAMQMVSNFLGHSRSDITRHYLR